MSEPQSPTVCRLLLEAMALVVAADEEGEDRETPVVGEIYQALSGHPLDATGWTKTLDAARSEPDQLWQHLVEHDAVLVPAEKEALLTGVVRVCIADAELQESELHLLNKIARKLGMAGPQLRVAMNRAWHEERGRV